MDHILEWYKWIINWTWIDNSLYGLLFMGCDCGLRSHLIWSVKNLIRISSSIRFLTPSTEESIILDKVTPFSFKYLFISAFNFMSLYWMIIWLIVANCSELWTQFQHIDFAYLSVFLTTCTLCLHINNQHWVYLACVASIIYMFILIRWVWIIIRLIIIYYF